MHLIFRQPASDRRDSRGCYLANRMAYAHLNRLAFPKLLASIDAEKPKPPFVPMCAALPGDLDILHDSQRACKTVPNQ